MLSPPDLLIIGAAALIFFGPDQLPKVARRAGQVIRDVQNTSQGFIREMERAADTTDLHTESAPYEYKSYAEPSPAPGAVDLSPPFAYAASPEHVVEAEAEVAGHQPSMFDPIAGTPPSKSAAAATHDDASGI